MPAPIRVFLVLSVLLAGCVAARPAAPVSGRPPARPVSRQAEPAPAPPVRTTPVTAEAPPLGRWIALDVIGDADATRDLRVGTLEKVLVVNPGGHVILRGVDRRQSPDPVSYSGMLVGRVLTFADLPGAAILAHEGTRLILTDPTGRQTRFVRAAD